MAYLELKHITKRFRSVVANEDVSLSVEKGHIHALLGENGAGKSTLMNILYGLYSPTSGEIWLDGKKLDIRNPKQAIAAGIGMVHQHFMLIPALSVIENVMLGYKEFSKVRLNLNQAAKLQVSRSTIRAVLTELEVEGKVIRRHGSGTYVNPQALDIETTIYPRVNMYELICKNGYKPHLQVTSFQNTPAGDRGNKLNILPNELVTEVHSIYSADDEPCMYCIDCVDARRMDGLNWKNHEQYAESIHDFIRRMTQVNIAWDIIRIRSAHSGQMPQLQETFRVPEGQIKPLVLLEIVNFDIDNQPALYGNIYVDADKIQLNIARDLSKL